MNLAPGCDLLPADDLAIPAHPRLGDKIELPNSIIGPPTNLAMKPDGTLGLMANALMDARVRWSLDTLRWAAGC